MASGMLDRILEAEAQAKENKEKALADAKAIELEAERQAKELVASVKNKAQLEANEALDNCRVKAAELMQQNMERAKVVCEKMEKDALLRQQDCTKIILDKILCR